LSQYKDHPIYGFGVLAAADKWCCRGLVFDAGDKVTEIKKIERAELIFETEEKAKTHALQLCKTWIDEQSEAGSATGQAFSAGPKNLPPLIG